MLACSQLPGKRERKAQPRLAGSGLWCCAQWKGSHRVGGFISVPYFFLKLHETHCTTGPSHQLLVGSLSPCIPRGPLPQPSSFPGPQGSSPGPGLAVHYDRQPAPLTPLPLSAFPSVTVPESSRLAQWLRATPPCVQAPADHTSWVA